MKKYIKYLFYLLGVTRLWDLFVFRIARIRFYKRNHSYLSKHPGILLPDDYDLHETFQLDYQKYWEEGELAAREIGADTKQISKNAGYENILDWGCGTGRITRHLQKVFPTAQIFGCDTNDRRMEWNQRHPMGIHFSTIALVPPTLYSTAFFDLIIGFSVLTHIDAESQDAWIAELYRILKPGGLLWLTTQGEAYTHQLLGFEKRKLHASGVYTRKGKQPGHRMMSTYHHAKIFQKKLSNHFAIRQFYPGKTNPAKTGGQDLWLLQK
ncbi:MAG: class I SAM-dependent methyltransferase [Bacteroidota bacterium]|nr:class I SAM-dependent methyltransferase [Bacteroidota bacterium]